MRAKTYHMTVDLCWLLRQPEPVLTSITRQDGTRLSAQEVRALALEKLRAGYTVLPVCEDYGPDGGCLGHPHDTWTWPGRKNPRRGEGEK
jgi:hypothetical protein